jgi:hypothetical protein
MVRRPAQLTLNPWAPVTHMATRGPEELRRLEQRVARLEKALGATLPRPVVAVERLKLHPLVPLLLGFVVLACGYLGLGLPQHYYQPLFAGLVLALAYHRRFWTLASNHWRWPLAAVNFLVLCLFFKLVIGGGTRYPLDWLRAPALTKTPLAEGSPWYEQVFPHFDIEWQAIPAVTDLSVDITMIQTMLLIATLAGALFRFQPFASLTAVLLLLVSIPTFLGFNWDWVVLFLVFGGIALYLQTGELTSLSPSPRAKRD